MNLTAFLNSDYAQNPHYLLFGHPVEHSWSPLMHNIALDYYNLDARYYAVDLQENELSRLASYLNEQQFLGANVTIPYKQRIKQYLDSIEDIAREIGAVNTIVKDKVRIKGFNTDVKGFLHPLQKFREQLEGERALIFGTGGAARAVVAGLQNIGIHDFYLISRNPGQRSMFGEHSNVSVKSYNNWTTFAEDAQLIVNTTPLGMYPKTDKSPVKDFEVSFLENSICYDLVYNPNKTTFLQRASSAGAKETIGGLEMLLRQAGESFKLWTKKEFPIKKVRTQLDEQLQR